MAEQTLKLDLELPETINPQVRRECRLEKLGVQLTQFVQRVIDEQTETEEEMALVEFGVAISLLKATGTKYHHEVLKSWLEPGRIR